MSRRAVWGLTLALMLLIILPYVLAYGVAGSRYVFNGFLLNPIDGQSYLAKMRLGWEGSWRFVLMYGADRVDGGPLIFLNYLALGHLARWFNLPMVLVFHLMRVVGSLVMVSGLVALFRSVLPAPAQKMALVLSLFGGGMGWVVVFFGLLPADVWLVEMYPFLSAYTNPHFPLGLGVLLWMMVVVLRAAQLGSTFRGRPLVVWRALLLAVLGLVFGAVQPFGLVVLAVVLGIWLIWGWLVTRRVAWAAWLAAGAAVAPGGLYVLYQFLAIRNDALLAGWNAQNLTPAPPLWNLLLALSPVLLVAAASAVAALRGTLRVDNEQTEGMRLLLVWLVAGMVMAYLPLALQRRFLMGYFVPLAGLAALGLAHLQQRWPQQGRRAWRLTLALALPTNAVILLMAGFGMLSHAPEIYLTQDESAVLSWLRVHSAPDALVLASPEMGLYIPAQTGRRVLYGHPFETVNAAQEEQAVLAVYGGQVRGDALARFVDQRGIDWIVYGARERDLGGAPDFSRYRLAFEQGEEQIFAVDELP